MDDLYTFSAKLEAKTTEQQTSIFQISSDGCVWKKVQASSEAEARQSLVRLFLKEGYFVKSLICQNQEHLPGAGDED